MLAGCRELSACRPDPIMQRFDGASSLNGSEDRAPGGSVPRCRAVTPSLDSELMPEADPFDFVNTDCRLFFFFFFLLLKCREHVFKQDFSTNEILLFM